MVHLFEWHWDTIADECERFLGPKKVGGIQISPPNENRVIGDRPWWERYQPVSYTLTTRSGDRAALKDMIDRCHAVGVNVYADAVINHMASCCGQGTGTAGSSMDYDKESFPAVPYSHFDFNDNNCNTASGGIENYNDANQVRNCRLVGLIDLNQGTDYVRNMIIDYFNDLLSLGVDGFRVDAVKHMWPGDVNYIFTNTDKTYNGKNPYFVSEVIDKNSGEPIHASDYFSSGQVTDFMYGIEIKKNIHQIHYLKTFGESWGLLPDYYSLTFLNNHDNQRDAADTVITFQNDPYDFKIATAFQLAWPYGVSRVMSSYYFSDFDAGPPGNQRSVNSDTATTCGNGWACEHRWKVIAPMFEFEAVVEGTKMNDWWDNGKNQIAFGRGDQGFIAINKDSYTLKQTLQTGLAPGQYKDVVSGNVVTVDSNRKVYVELSNNDDNNVFAIHAGSKM